MIILGIDPGLRCTGWALIEHQRGGPRYMDCGVITPKDNINIESRLLKIHTELINVIKKFSPSVVALEKVFVNSNGSTTLKLGEARGVILMTQALMGLTVVEYAPNTIKKTITGLGHASKEQVKKMVQLVLPHKEFLKKRHDAIDALAIALCHYYYLRL